jgi:hypothetical protein
MTTQSDIREWLDRRKESHTHMIVVCDTFDHEDFPVFVEKGEDIHERVKYYSNSERMTRVMEVYNLGIPLTEQLAQERAFNY